MAYKETGDSQSALKYLNQSVQLNKTPPAELFRTIGNIHNKLNEKKEALENYDKALIIKPDYPEVHFCLGNLHASSGRDDEAIQHFKKDLKIRPDNAVTHINIANSLKNLGHEERAIAHYNEAISISPNDPNIYNNRANAYKNIGMHQNAILDYEKALALRPNFIIALRNLLSLKPSPDLINAVEDRIDKSDLNEKGLMELYFALGNYYDNQNVYSKAFNFYDRANTIRRKQIRYNPKTNTEFVDFLIKTFNKEFIYKTRKFGLTTSLPVFIIGMPRSGTTLAEQIISSHPKIYGAGELYFLHTIEKNIITNSAHKDYERAITNLTKTEVKRYARKYLDQVSHYSNKAAYVADKLPANFYRVGLIKLLFPNAKIIHCIRNPEDTCTSIYLNYFPNGNEYSFDLIELGKYYKDYERLMTYWNKIYPSQIYNVRYEDIVNNLEHESRKIIKFLDLRWSKKCLEFYNNNRSVRTASNLQVRKPIYTKSINRWENYAEYLQPLITTLNTQ